MAKLKVDITWEDNYGAYSEQVPGVVATHKILDGVKAAFANALDFHIVGMLEDNDEIPEALLGAYDLYFELDIQALLKYLDGKVTRSAVARVSGINERQLGHYITGRVKPRPGNRQKIVSGIQQLGNELLHVV